MIGIWGTMMAMKLAAGALALMVGMGAVQSAEANRRAAAAAATATLAVERTIATNTNDFAESEYGFLVSKEVTHTITVERETIVRISASSETADLVLLLKMPNGSFIENDDTDGLNPQIVARVPAGSHQVRLGLFTSTLDTKGAFTVKFSVAEGTEAELEASQESSSEHRAPTFSGGPTGTIARGSTIEQTVNFSSAHPMGELGCVNADEPSYTVSVPSGVSGTLTVAVPVTDELADPMFIAFRENGSYDWDDDGGEGFDSLENITVQGGEVFYIFVGSPTCSHGSGQTKLKISLN